MIRSWKDLKQLRIREPIGLMPEDQSSQSVIDFTIWINSIFETSPMAYTLKGWRMMCKKLEPLAGLGRLFREKDWKKIRSMLKTYPSLYVLTHSQQQQHSLTFCAQTKGTQRTMKRMELRFILLFDTMHPRILSCHSSKTTLDVPSRLMVMDSRLLLLPSRFPTPYHFQFFFRS